METICTERLQQFEDNCLLNKEMICSATYIKNGNLNNNCTAKAALLTDITICNTNYTVDHLWVKDPNKSMLITTKWKSKQHQIVYFIAKFIKITKPESLYKTKTDLNLKIIKIIK